MAFQTCVLDAVALGSPPHLYEMADLAHRSFERIHKTRGCFKMALGGPPVDTDRGKIAGRDKDRQGPKIGPEGSSQDLKPRQLLQ